MHRHELLLRLLKTNSAPQDGLKRRFDLLEGLLVFELQLGVLCVKPEPLGSSRQKGLVKLLALPPGVHNLHVAPHVVVFVRQPPQSPYIEANQIHTPFGHPEQDTLRVSYLAILSPRHTASVHIE